MIYHRMKKCLIFLTMLGILASLLTTFAFAAASGKHYVVDGVRVEVSGATDNSWKNNELTVTAKGSGGIFGMGASDKTATIKVYNDKSEGGATISFDWTASSVCDLDRSAIWSRHCVRWEPRSLMK